MFDDSLQYRIIGDTRFSGLFDGKQDVIDRLLGPLSERLDGHLHLTADNMIGEGDFVAVQGRVEDYGRQYLQQHVLLGLYVVRQQGGRRYRVSRH